MARAEEFITHLLLAGESFTITADMGVTSLSVVGTSETAVTMTGAGMLATPSLNVGGDPIPINQSLSINVQSKESNLLDGITIASPSTGTAIIIMQK
jgi:hypothetical protein